MVNADLLRGSDEFSVNIQKIDEQHQVLVDPLSQLHHAIREHHGRPTARAVLGRLAEYTRTPFLKNGRVQHINDSDKRFGAHLQKAGLAAYANWTKDVEKTMMKKEWWWKFW